MSALRAYLKVAVVNSLKATMRFPAGHQAVGLTKLIAGRQHFWQARYYDFNVFTSKKRIEKLKYVYRNRRVRGS